MMESVIEQQQPQQYAQAAVEPEAGYNFAFLDEQTKRMIRRAILKAVAIPGYQVPFGGREMPLPYGWGTGGIQVLACAKPKSRNGSQRTIVMFCSF